MTTQKKNSRLSARAILCQILGMLMALTVALPVSFAAADDEIHALHQAVDDGDRAEVKRLLSAGADVNAGDADGWTPLSYAVDTGNVEIIADLLAAGADANVANVNADDESSLLHWGAQWDYPAVIDILVGKGADINRQNEDGETALHWAAKHGRPAAARALIKGGADVNSVDGEEYTPLHIAALENHDVVMGILIDNGADLRRANNRGDTPLHDAAWIGNIESVELLINVGADTTRENDVGRTPLYYAQEQGHNEIADMLIATNDDYVFPSPPEGESASARVFDSVWESIVRVNSADGGHGSGVVVAPETVATNCHVVEGDARDIVIRKAYERRIDERDEHRIKSIDGNPELDFCLLHVPGLDGIPAKIRRYKTLRVGEDVYAVGNPEGFDLSLSAGIISQLREDGARQIQTDASISQGSSGGGLFDKEGNLIGITTWSWVEGVDPQNLNFAIPADWFFGY